MSKTPTKVVERKRPNEKPAAQDSQYPQSTTPKLVWMWIERSRQTEALIGMAVRGARLQQACVINYDKKKSIQFIGFCKYSEELYGETNIFTEILIVIWRICHADL